MIINSKAGNREGVKKFRKHETLKGDDENRCIVLNENATYKNSYHRGQLQKVSVLGT
jgi:hypothetical protein